MGIHVHTHMYVLGNSFMIFRAKAAQKSAFWRSGELMVLVSDLEGNRT